MAPLTPARAMELMDPWTAGVTGGQVPKMVEYRESMVTPCGVLDAGGKVYPFYCEPSQTIYWPTGWNEGMDPVSVGLSLSHENGHFIMGRLPGKPGDPFVAERRADCYAGAWLAQAGTHGVPEAADPDVLSRVGEVFASTPAGGPYRAPEGRTSDVSIGMTLGPDACATIATVAP